MRVLSVIRYTVLILLSGALSGYQSASSKERNIRVLILNGSNNHEWKQTGSVLQSIFQSYEGFQSKITNRPDTLTFQSLKQFDVLVSNWNSWPENELRWSETAEEGLLKFIHQGGGLVTFHASSSAFYRWEQFREITTASWEEGTHHGKLSPVRLEVLSGDHPITRGLSDFFIFDELWIDARSNKKYTTLAYASNADQKEDSAEKQAAVMVADYGHGRIFHTILGHDARSMRNTGFQSLMVRGTEWAATGQVSSAIPQEMKILSAPASERYHWLENDSTFALYNHEDIIWQYNFRNRFGRSFFHPVFVGKTRMTSLSPEDHRWHLGQWFSWKFIDGINYWEYVGEGYSAEGTTHINDISYSREADFSARIELEILYHPGGGLPVLKEHRSILVSPPSEGSLTMDYEFRFEALSDSVLLDRTPIPGEADGKSWGGYAGLSLRFNLDFMEAHWIAPGSMQSVNGSDGEWFFMGFTGLHGEQAGSAMFISDQTRLKGEAWYLFNEPDLPFYYFSPSCLYRSPLTLFKGEELHLKYRIRHQNGTTSTETLTGHYQDYINP